MAGDRPSSARRRSALDARKSQPPPPTSATISDDEEGDSDEEIDEDDEASPEEVLKMALHLGMNPLDPEDEVGRRRKRPVGLVLKAAPRFNAA